MGSYAKVLTKVVVLVALLSALLVVGTVTVGAEDFDPCCNRAHLSGPP
jgi:hypothetical protein